MEEDISILEEYSISQLKKGEVYMVKIPSDLGLDTLVKLGVSVQEIFKRYGLEAICVPDNVKVYRLKVKDEQ